MPLTAAQQIIYNQHRLGLQTSKERQGANTTGLKTGSEGGKAPGLRGRWSSVAHRVVCLERETTILGACEQKGEVGVRLKERHQQQQ